MPSRCWGYGYPLDAYPEIRRPIPVLRNFPGITKAGNFGPLVNQSRAPGSAAYPLRATDLENCKSSAQPHPEDPA